MDLEAVRWSYLKHVVTPAVGALGIRRADTLARLLGRRIAHLGLPGWRRAFERIRSASAPDRRDSAREAVAAMYENQARFWCEVLFARRLLHEHSWRRLVALAPECERRLVALKTERRPVVLTTAYFGNPAVAAWVLGRVFRPVHVIVDQLTQPVAGKWQRELLADRWVRPIGRAEAGRVLPGVLDGGGAVLIMAEAERRRGAHVAANFLGVQLRCYPTIGRLARWYRAPVVTLTCTRRATPFAFDLTLRDVIAPEAAERRADADDPSSWIVRKVLASLERAVLALPEQYLWSIETMESAGAPSQRTSGTVRAGTDPVASFMPGSIELTEMASGMA